MCVAEVCQMEQKENDLKFVPPPAAFKSRFLKTDKSAALKELEDSKSVPTPLLVNTSTAVGLRSLRSTFSPLAKLPENVEVRNGGGAGENGASKADDRLSKNIKAFIDRTDHVANEWRNLGQKRSGSVDRESGGPGSSWSLPKPKPFASHNVRASSVAPASSATQ